MHTGKGKGKSGISGISLVLCSGVCGTRVSGVWAEERLEEVATEVARRVVWVDVEGERDDGVAVGVYISKSEFLGGEGGWRLRSDTHCAFEVVALAVLDQVVHDKHAEEEDDGLEALEVQRHRLVDDPAQYDQERGDEERNLHAAADGDVDREIHLALVRDNDGCDMLGCVTDDRQEDQTDEGLADVRGFDNRVDAVD